MKRSSTWLSGTVLVACSVLLLGFDCGLGRDCVSGGVTHHSGDTFASDDGCNTCSCDDGNVACTARACVAQWWKSCGDPVCREHTVDPNVPPCTTEKLGEVCTALGHPCDINDPCNVHLVCAYSDPTKQPGGCPISRARAKTDIHYLDAAELDRVQKDLLGVRLANWRYKTAPADSPPQLGFIIDDLGAGPAINPDGESCEFAIVVADDWQGRGLARRLMEIAIAAAKQKGLKHMTGEFLAENTRMLKFVASLGFDLQVHPDDSALRFGVLPLNP